MAVTKILVVDDDRGERELFSRVLKKEGYEVKSAASGREALEKVGKESFNLVLADIRMPRMSGIHLLKEIKKLKPEVVVIMITAYAAVETAIQALRQGAYDYITKPLEDIDEIGFRVRRALERQSLGEENKRLVEELKAAVKELSNHKRKLEHKVVVGEEKMEQTDEDLRKTYRELKKAYADLEANIEEMKRLERLAAMGEFSAKIVHEIKNPLTSIDGFIQLLPAKYDSPEFRDKFIETTTREVERLKNFTDRMLKFARPPEPVLKPENVNEIIESTLTSAQDRASKQKAKITKKLKPDLPEAMVDAESIREVLVNLINNALEAMPEGGELTISTKLGAKKEFLEVELRDTGCGIVKENIPKIFEPFFTTKSKGSGLGLAICQGIIEKHNGRIEVKSQVGKGTTFTIALSVVKKAKSKIKNQNALRFAQDTSMNQSEVSREKSRTKCKNFEF